MTFHSNQQNLFEHISKKLNFFSKTHLFDSLFTQIYSKHLLYSQYPTDLKIIHYSICHFIPSLFSLSFIVLNAEMVSNISLRDCLLDV